MQLRWYQAEAVDATYNFLCSHKEANPVICLPTGAGKSIVIAELIRRAVTQFNGRVIVLQHRKELIEQNTDKVRKLIPEIKVGQYSAGLRKFATDEQVVLCGIQSVYSKATLFDRRDLILIDEVHLVPPDGEGMYQRFLTDMRTINSHHRVVGLTATPYRTGEGAICRPDGMFHAISYEAPIRQLIDEGFLSKVTNKPPQVQFDTSKLHMRYGEFIASEVEALFGGAETAEAIKEIVANTQDRKSIMVFCSSVKHAETVVAALKILTDDEVAFVEGNSTPLERAAALSGFASRQIRWIVNVDVLTTGFDAPCVDAIAILRATASPGLFAQIVGRGLRLYPGKENCLVLDFGGNIDRHGPIDAIDYGKNRVKRGGEKLAADDPGKECPACQLVVPTRKQVCDCGFRFAPERTPNHENAPETQKQIISEPITFKVIESRAQEHKGKDGKPNTLRMDYRVQRLDQEESDLDLIISEWVCILHEGFALRKAHEWWAEHSILEFPSTIEEAVQHWREGMLAAPDEITARQEGRFWRIVDRVVSTLPTVAQEFEEAPF